MFSGLKSKLMATVEGTAIERKIRGNSISKETSEYRAYIDHVEQILSHSIEVLRALRIGRCQRGNRCNDGRNETSF